MSIKDVTGLTGPRTVESTNRHPGGAAKHAPQEDSRTDSTSDTLSITSIGKYLAGAADDAAPVDKERVQAIRQALADGSYEIDADRVAAKLLRAERDLL